MGFELCSTPLSLSFNKPHVAVSTGSHGVSTATARTTLDKLRRFAAINLGVES